MTANTSPSGGSKRGPIIVSRHGRPALDRTARPRLGWRDYVDWWARYEKSSLAEGQVAPDDLKAAVADATKVLSSIRPRALETAQSAAPGRDVEQDGVFNEAPLPPPYIPGVKYLPKTWNILARVAWLSGHAMDGESVSQARIRAADAAARLHTESEAGKIYVAAHGWFNRMMRPELRKIGWQCTRDGGDGYWSYRIYEWRGD